MKAILFYVLVSLNPDTGRETRTHHSELMPTMEACGQVLAQLVIAEYPDRHFIFQDLECNPYVKP